MSASQTWYVALVLAIALERVGELAITRRNLAWARARGGREHGGDHYPWMVAIHASFLIACPLEVVALDRPFIPALGWPMLALLAGAMALRYWAIATLGPRWTTRVVVLPGLPVVTRGPYRWLRHPNYLAVVFEVLALPLVHTAWIVAVVWSAANALVLRARIASEESALRAASDYDAAMSGRRALVPSAATRERAGDRTTAGAAADRDRDDPDGAERAGVARLDAAANLNSRSKFARADRSREAP